MELTAEQINLLFYFAGMKTVIILQIIIHHLIKRAERILERAEQAAKDDPIEEGE